MSAAPDLILPQMPLIDGVSVLDLPADRIAKENNFWIITTDNEVIFPRLDKLAWTGFWWDFFNDKSRFRMVIVGRGGGKTHNVAFEEVMLAFSCYFTVKASGRRYTGAQWHAAFIFPAEENATECIAMLNEIIPEVPGYAPDGTLNYRVRGSDRTDFRLFGNNELVISIYSSQAGLRGKNFDQVWCDEGLKIKKTDLFDVIIPASDRAGRPEISGWLTITSTPDDEEGDPNEKWLDAAMDEADPDKPHITGYFSDYSLHRGPFTVNPYLSEARFQRILKRFMLGAIKFWREHLAIPGLISSSVRTADKVVWTLDQVRPCLYKERVVPKSVIGVIDLAFGSTDSLVRMWYCAAARKVFDLEIFDPKECNNMGINPKAYEDGLVDFFIKTCAMYPGAPIIYDSNSDQSMPISHLIPRHLRTIGIKKNNSVKTGLVTTLIEIMADVDDTGVCQSIGFPHPEAEWLTPKQRQHFKRLYKEMIEYERTQKEKRDGGIMTIYNKPPGGKDDALDTVIMLMSQVQPKSTSKLTASQARRMSGR